MFDEEFTDRVKKKAKSVRILFIVTGNAASLLRLQVK